MEVPGISSWTTMSGGMEMILVQLYTQRSAPKSKCPRHFEKLTLFLFAASTRDCER